MIFSFYVLIVLINWTIVWSKNVWNVCAIDEVLFRFNNKYLCQTLKWRFFIKKSRDQNDEWLKNFSFRFAEFLSECFRRCWNKLSDDLDQQDLSKTMCFFWLHEISLILLRFLELWFYWSNRFYFELYVYCFCLVDVHDVVFIVLVIS